MYNDIMKSLIFFDKLVVILATVHGKEVKNADYGYQDQKDF